MHPVLHSQVLMTCIGGDGINENKSSAGLEIIIVTRFIRIVSFLIDYLLACSLARLPPRSMKPTRP